MLDWVRKVSDSFLEIWFLAFRPWSQLFLVRRFHAFWNMNTELVRCVNVDTENHSTHFDVYIWMLINLVSQPGATVRHHHCGACAACCLRKASMASSRPVQFIPNDNALASMTSAKWGTRLCRNSALRQNQSAVNIWTIGARRNQLFFVQGREYGTLAKIASAWNEDGVCSIHGHGLTRRLQKISYEEGYRGYFVL